MALIRGFRGLCPCVICLVPQEKQRNVSKQYPLRTQVGTQAILEKAKNLAKGEAEQLLKENGLHPVEVIF